MAISIWKILVQFLVDFSIHYYYNKDHEYCFKLLTTTMLLYPRSYQKQKSFHSALFIRSGNHVSLVQFLLNFHFKFTFPHLVINEKYWSLTLMVQNLIPLCFVLMVEKMFVVRLTLVIQDVMCFVLMGTDVFTVFAIGCVLSICCWNVSSHIF